MPHPSASARFRIGIDTGGTFTDIVSVDTLSGATEVTKVASTPANPGIALVRGVKAILAAHGATTGQLDEQLLYYLLSRGLAASAARSLLKWAFLSETLAVVGPQELRKAAEVAVAARLHDAPAAELLQ